MSQPATVNAPPGTDWSFLLEPTPWQNNKSSILAVTITAMVISGLCVLFRLYTRLRILRAPGLDDLFVAFYLAMTIMSSTAVGFAPDYGLGKHLVYLSKDDLKEFLLLFYIANASYICATAFIKLSLLFQYLRIYDSSSPWRYVSVFLIVLISLWGLAFSFMAWVPCFPVREYWEGTGTGKCYGFGITTDRTVFVIHTSLNMIFDILVWSVLVPLFFAPDTSRNVRVGIVLLGLLGVIVNMFAAWRLVLLVQEENSIMSILDATWHAPDTILLAVMEGSLASICASIPIFWPVIAKRLGYIFVTSEVKVEREKRDAIESRDDGASDLASNVTTHYTDPFIMNQVDPFAAVEGVATRVKSDSMPSRKTASRAG